MKEEIISVAVQPVLPFNISIAGTSYCDGSYRICRSASDVTCVEYIISGCGVVHCDSKTVYPREGDMYILPKNTSHTYYSDSQNPWVKIWFNAYGDLAPQLLTAYSLNRLILFESCDGSAYIRRIHELCKNAELSAYEIQTKCAAEFFGLIQFLSKNTVFTDSQSDADIIKDYIDRNAAGVISVGELAALISKSVSQTIRIFKKTFGITPYEYLLEQKLDRAKLMLKGSNMSVKDISAAISFSDEHYFSGLFRKKTGLSPCEYRRL